MPKADSHTTKLADLLDALRPLAHVAELIDRAHDNKMSDDVGLWSRQSNFGDGFTLTLGDARRARRLVNGE